MSYPTTEQLASWAQTLSATNWTKLAGRLANAIDRDRRGGSAIPDGFPASTGNGSGAVTELTAVEAAVHARTTARDEHHDRTTNAVGYLEQAVMSLGALVTQLNRIEAQVVHVDGREPGCSHHAQFDLREERYRGDLCRCCYDFKAEFGVLPTADLIDDRSRGIKWNSARITRSLADARR